MGKFSIFLLLSLAAALTSYGQDAAQKPSPTEEQRKIVNVNDLAYRLKGADIPRYHLVRIFLLETYSRIQDAEGQVSKSADIFYDDFLEEIGVERGTDAEAALRRAAERYGIWEYGPGGPIVEIREGKERRRDGTTVPTVESFMYGEGIKAEDVPELNPQDDESVVQEKVRAHHAKKAQALADIYYDLLGDLTKCGVSTVGVERYLFNKIAAHSSLASDEPHDSLRPYEAAFEERLEMRKSGQLSSKQE